MPPTPAELARTLAAGRLPGVAHVAFRPGPHPVRHVTDPLGRVLLLVPSAGRAARALRPEPGVDDAAIVLDVPDVPPLPGAPGLGRVRISGWVSPLAGEAAREAALQYADVDPAGDLLDVGRAFTLHRVEVAEVRLERGGTTVEVDPDDYRDAEPDPLHAVEAELLADLAGHHGPELGDYLRRQLRVAGRDGGPEPPRVVRLDRYGFVVALGAGRAPYARLAFPHPVRDRAELARLLHPVLCRRCAGRCGRPSET
ncbi:hypothetical protein SAMN05444365_105248 [Micromonospora pattaloongensis]|uniref:DUF2470 domain-containing protein n=1 Tax=Micromonospora pattaloongensis TaxID=405436 RepID=A0A1H3Q527_9ACTN|nr:DUF2470 domain-containing protein [Micromonospora pattaloongensis]SDZ08652.1 hypothetical protein SAMN05444365_105248 [Micromonospora pattaloongensis]